MESDEGLPPTRYVSGSGVHIAFQTYAAGRLDVLVLPGFVSRVERIWEQPRYRAFLSSLVSFCSIVAVSGFLTGSGSPPASMRPRRTFAPCLMPPKSRRIMLFGASEGGPACTKFAVDHLDRVAGLILFASLAKGSATPDYPHALQAHQYDMWLKQLIACWGGPGIETFAPSCLAILRREHGGQGCSGPRRAPEPSRAYSRRCAIPMCGIF
jgi:hypothetical protein